MTPPMLQAAAGPGIDAKPQSILVVEDDPETRRFYITVLTTDGFTADEAHNGHQALEKAIAAPPDLVLTDIAVPGLDGIELCRRLRANARTRHVPVLAVTGYDDRHYPDRIIQAGANHVLLKPLDAGVLLAEARRLLTKDI
jgi:DNA-binding response OmpR family regulator